MKILLSICLALFTLSTGPAATAEPSRGSGVHRDHSARGQGHGHGHRHGHWGHFRHARHHGHHSSFGITIGAPFFWGVPHYYHPYPHTVIVDRAPVTYIEQPTVEQHAVPSAGAQEQNFWYHCPDQGYYPYVTTCPQGWRRVLPDTVPQR